MGIIYIDDKPIEYQQGDNVLEAARRAGIDMPYFCYHPALGAAGSCRICAMETVPQKEGERPRTVMTCTVSAQDGQHYKSQSSKAKQIQKGVIEFYMTNHPNDCPVCDEGGDCHLQDTTINVGHAYRRYDGLKRTMPNQELGPLVYQTMNRCVTCYRCVRFYQNYALGDDFGVMGSSSHVLFRRTEDGAFDSPFSGNLVSICPTGVFTDKVYRRKYSRTWMLDKAISICAGCSVGCSIDAGGREGTLRRIHPSEKSEINPYFICDRGRYGAHGTEADDRPLQVLEDGLPLPIMSEATVNIALEPTAYLAEVLREAQGRVGILGSVEEDLLTNLALRQLALQLDAPFSPFITPMQEAQTKAAVAANTATASVADIENADLVLVIGELTEHAPMLDLAVRQVIKQHRPVYIAHSAPSHLVTASNKYQQNMNYCCAPSRWQPLLVSLAQACSGRDVNTIWANQFALAAQQAQTIVVVGVAELLDVGMIEAMTALAVVLGDRVKMTLALPAAGSMAAAIMAKADSCQQLIQQLKNDQLDTLVVVGSDPFGDAPHLWSSLRHKVKRIVVADKVNTTSIKLAHSVIPLAAWPERNGLTINYEGRLQAFKQAFKRKQPLLSAEMIIQHLADFDRREINDFVEALTESVPVAGDMGVRLIALKRNIVLSAQERKRRFSLAPSQTAQATLVRWHGAGYVADHAHSLQLIKPVTGVYLSSVLVEQFNVGNGDRVLIKHGDNSLDRMVIVNSQVADYCVALSRTDLSALAADIGAALEITKAPNLFIEASLNVDEIKQDQLIDAMVGEANE